MNLTILCCTLSIREDISCIIETSNNNSLKEDRYNKQAWIITFFLIDHFCLNISKFTSNDDLNTYLNKESVIVPRGIGADHFDAHGLAS